MEVPGDPPPPIPAVVPPKRGKKTAQEVLSDFWDKFHTKKPGKVTTIFPRSLYRAVLPPNYPAGARSSRNASESYDAAAKECREKVRRIVRECERTNEKFTDPDFDIEHDDNDNCLNGLISGDSSDAGAPPDLTPSVDPWQVKNSLETLAQSQILGGHNKIAMDASALSRIIGAGGGQGFFPGGSGGSWANPGSVHRVDWIFDSPQFTVNGFSSSDIKQGGDGDCWWLAAIATIAHRKDLMEKVCVARDEDCGVYGFVFQRDGEWISTVIDDNLYLKETDFDYYRDVYDATGKKARRHRKENQTGSDALYFAHCEDPNETWLPLLEKAYAKIHGDYEAISGGWPGEAVEDMTGGVTTTLESNRVLRKDKLWKELVSSEGEYVFALAAMSQGWDWKRSGLALGHAYSILQSREEVDEDGNKVRLVQIRNPWGQRGWNGIGEWNGPWSDGSKEWTPYWLKKMNHTFGDDGVFWMSFKDMLDNFMYLHRTRLFDEKWTVVQQWTSANISWVTGYLQTKFEVIIKKAGLVVLVLTQLDDRFFRGFEGEYTFELHFLLQEAGAPTTEHICRVRPVKMWKARSVSCEVHLEPGRYKVLPKITATRNGGSQPVEEVVKEYAENNPQKLRQVGMQYDLAHAKGGIPDEDELLEAKKAADKKKKDEKKRKRKEKAKRDKAITKVAEAMEKAADAVKEIVKSDQKSTEAKKEGKEAEPVDKPSESKDGAKTTPEGTASTDQPVKPTEQPKVSTESKPDSGPSTVAPAGAMSTDSKKDDLKAPSGLESLTQGIKDAPVPAEENAKESTAIDEVPKEAEKKEDKKDDEEEEDSESESESEPDNDDETPTNPWNAVAVIGLRIYTRDPEVTIKLQSAKPEEATALTLEGEPAGATV
ncbi:hypothetical protein SUNI508_08422 [Seiridium unicorne]|uniref:Calpain catalytic domain-containing protein n=1 Tax=Seiridium unicorne TaxID=138068 RepID=A0ABR2UTJ8_9PEZI